MSRHPSNESRHRRAASNVDPSRPKGGAAIWAGVARRVRAVGALGGPIARRGAPVLRAVTRVGWVALGAGVIGWIAGAMLGWIELLAIATGCLVLCVLCGLMTIGGKPLVVRIDLSRLRVAVGVPSAGRVVAVNRSGRRLWPTDLEVPVAGATSHFHLPRLAPGDEHEALLKIPARPRGLRGRASDHGQGRSARAVPANGAAHEGVRAACAPGYHRHRFARPRPDP